MKRILLPILAAMCMIGFTACGNADSESSSSQENTTSQTEAVQQETQEQSDGAANDDDKTTTERSEETAKNADVPESSGKDTIVIFFSATGTTKGVAEKIANITNADIYEIIPAEPYSDADLDWNDKNSRTTIEMNDPSVRPTIADDSVDLSGYSTVYIGYPIWWGEAPRIMSTFVEAHSFEGMTVIPFCTSGGSGIGRSGENLASQAGSGNWLDGERLDGGISESEIQDWINGIN